MGSWCWHERGLASGCNQTSLSRSRTASFSVPERARGLFADLRLEPSRVSMNSIEQIVRVVGEGGVNRKRLILAA
jgi:hypothetical protein